MHEVGDLVNLLLEDAEGIGIGDHEGGHVFVHLRGEGGDVDHAAVVGLQIFDGIADSGGGGGIGAVGRVGDQDFFAGVAF